MPKSKSLIFANAHSGHIFFIHCRFDRAMPCLFADAPLVRIPRYGNLTSKQITLGHSNKKEFVLFIEDHYCLVKNISSHTGL